MSIDLNKVIYDKILIDKLTAKVEKLKKDSSIEDEIIKDKVFQILENQGKVLYFPLNDKNDGMYIKKHINGEEVKIIYINTEKPYYDQIFAAAHELGHIYRTNEIKNQKFSPEEITDRFAAELLLPIDKVKKVCEKFFQREKVYVGEFLDFLGDIMIEYKVSFSTIVRRIVELYPDKKKLFEIMFQKVSEEQCIEYINLYLNEHNTDINVPTQKKYITGLKEILKQSKKNNEKNILADKLLITFSVKSIDNPNFESEIDCEEK